MWTNKIFVLFGKTPGVEWLGRMVTWCLIIGAAFLCSKAAEPCYTPTRSVRVFRFLQVLARTCCLLLPFSFWLSWQAWSGISSWRVCLSLVASGAEHLLLYLIGGSFWLERRGVSSSTSLALPPCSPYIFLNPTHPKCSSRSRPRGVTSSFCESRLPVNTRARIQSLPQEGSPDKGRRYPDIRDLEEHPSIFLHLCNWTLGAWSLGDNS